MATSKLPVMELVQNTLQVSVADFMQVFTSTMEPTLLAQPGIIGIMTGVQSPPDSQDQAPIVVSMALWESLEAHQDFLASPAANPFFEAVTPLLVGPPTIQHYNLGGLDLSSLKKLWLLPAKSRYSWIHKFPRADFKNYQEISKQHAEKFGHGTAIWGDCIEIPLYSSIITFGDNPDFKPAANASDGDKELELLKVSWQKVGNKKITQSL